MTRRGLLLLSAAALSAADGEKPPSLSAKLAAPPRWSLGPFTAPRPAGVDQRDPMPLQIGSHRPVQGDAINKGKWAKLPDGRRIWRLEIQSPGAKRLRLHFDNFAVGKGRVWLLDGPPGDVKVSGPYSGKGIDGIGEFWSDTVSGDAVIIEFLPEGKAPKMPPFQLKEISHLYQ